jgi:hypothetical protein
MISLPNPVSKTMMMLQVTEVDFDFDDDYGNVDDEELQIAEDYKNKVVESVVGNVYEVEDEDELADVISDETGWCVRSLNYIQIVESV